MDIHKSLAISLYALIDIKISEDFTLILKLVKSLSSRIFIFNFALSTNASGFGSEYLSKTCFSRLPEFTPTRIEQLLSFAALITSLILSVLPIFPGFILMHAAPFFADSIALYDESGYPQQ